MSTRVVINAPSPWIRRRRGRYPAYRACGEVGVAGGLILVEALTIHAGRSPLVMAAVAGIAVVVFLGLVHATRAFAGEERLVYYHHQVAILSVCAVGLVIAGRPLLGYLDTLALGIGVVLAFGRVGCTMAGCCHGKPARWGIRYGVEHVANGLGPNHLAVPLIPVQLVESALVLGLVAAGSLEVISGARAGTALLTYIAGYALVRFILEFLRGDPERRFVARLSVAQWWSVALASGALVATLAAV